MDGTMKASKFVKRKRLIFVIILVFAFSSAVLYLERWLTEPSFLSTNSKYYRISFDDNSSLYISTFSGGLLGNHERITISKGKRTDKPIKDKDLIFYTSEIFYKIDSDNNKLVVFVTSDSFNATNDIKNRMNVKIKTFKNYDEWKDYDKNYLKYGLKKISVSSQ